MARIAGLGQTARAGVKFVNSTPQTLPPGTVVVFSSGGFAGESALDRLKPGERQFIEFGADLDVSAEALPKPAASTADAPQRLTWDVTPWSSTSCGRPAPPAPS